MTAQPEAEATRRWVEKADNDLRNAEYVLTMPEGCPTDTVCFHCQQCVEKYLKALLTLKGIDFARTHDVVVLLNLLKAADFADLSVQQVQPLNRYSVEARYPGDWEPISVEDAATTVRLAQHVREVIRGALPAEVLPSGD